MERRGWFFEKWGLETNPPKKRDRRAASVYHAQVNCDGNVSSNEAETGKRGTFEYVQAWLVGIWEKAGNRKALSCLYFEGTFKRKKSSNYTSFLTTCYYSYKCSFPLPPLLLQQFPPFLKGGVKIEPQPPFLLLLLFPKCATKKATCERTLLPHFLKGKRRL